MFPSKKAIYIPLLQELIRRGGSSKPSQSNEKGLTIYQSLADYFDLSEEAKNLLCNTSDTDTKWMKFIRWAKLDLVKKGLVYAASNHKIWVITEEGRKHVEQIEGEKIGRGIFDSKQKISLELFRKKQSQAAEIGERGEKFVLQYESQFLINYGKKDLANKVSWTAQEDVGAGYDILSFDLQGNLKYIEVKTSESDILDFYLTENELNIAQKHGLYYWIYKVININSSPRIAIKIQDPAENINQGKLVIKPTAYRVIVGEELEDNKEQI